MIEELKKEIKEQKRWSSKCLAILEYHTLMEASRAGVRNHKWKIKDSADELNHSVGFISESLNLARAIEKNPRLKDLTREEALKRIRNG